ncbi:aminopeptidase [Candidatus Pacearchaeota archaeon]|nr:aminopeptidase [Candidatus Pacearchaeota archaeon]
MDPRTRKLAQLILKYSLKVLPDTNVMISGGIEAQEFILELYKQVILQGAYPLVNITLPGMTDFYYKHASDKQLKKFPDLRMHTVKNAKFYVGIDTTTNTRSLSNCDPKRIAERMKITRPISNYVCNEKDKIKRVTVGFPCMALAQEGEMSLNEFENFVYSACLQDWKKLGKKLDKIKKKFENGRGVHLIGPNVDLKFSINHKNCVADKGEENMPGGEVFMAPVRESLNGWIKFEYPAIYLGQEVSGIFLRFELGKVIEASATKNEKLLQTVLETDENASYVGEFGIGLNPGITKYTRNLLFDEKIEGTIHLALGMAYKDNGGGNDSAIHWDIVKNMRKGKIILDKKVVCDKGKWKI